ncbi:hypothetical protein MTO96_038634 [Rhipicephalus appendiculatus]
MKVPVVWALFVVAVHGLVMVPPDMAPMSDEMINFINNLNTTWKAGRNSYKNVPKKCSTSLEGALPEDEGFRLPLKDPEEIPSHLPEYFDTRETWSSWCQSVSVIYNQGGCHACWAVGTAGVISDRICIHTRGRLNNVFISALDLVACCSRCGNNSNGCNGGYPAEAWFFYLNAGIVTGGKYGTKVGCKPYTFPPTSGEFLGPTASDPLPAPACRRNCDNGDKSEYCTAKHYAQRVYGVPPDEEHIKYEIYVNGPVQAQFSIYSDFYSYESGVYIRRSNVRCAGHVVRILGWGTENGVPYWLVANSWGENWGERGYFKIRRGYNECEIEMRVNAGIPLEGP